ncbi:MAG: mercury(II) reductase [Candidatus Hodarchaeales archaeon]
MNGDSQKEEIKLKITGMTCDSCATHVNKALKSVDGVYEVTIDHWTSKTATVLAKTENLDQKLLEAVREAGYKAEIASRKKLSNVAQISNEETDYDLIVIGTGGGGMAAAIKGAELGFKVAIIESGTVGGTCVNIGCIPSKALIHATKAYFSAGHHSFKGIMTQVNGIEWKTLIEEKNELVNDLRQKKYIDVLSSYEGKIELISGKAALKKGNSVVVEGKTITAKKIVLATGAKPKILPMFKDIEVLDSTSALSMKHLPESIIVVGGRAVALELGQMLSRAGTDVTILQRSPRILPEHEPEISESLKQYLQAEGLRIYTNVKIRKVTKEAGAKTIVTSISGKETTFKAKEILLAVGKDPNTKNMGLEDVGVKLDEKGFILIDEHLQTSNPHVYAAGDVTVHPKFVYVAATAGGIAAENALNGNQKKFDLSVLPTVVFTDPQVAVVGLTESEAKEQGYNVKTTLLSMEHVPHAITSRNKRGLIKLVVDKDSNRLLGAHILAPNAGDIIQVATFMVKFGMQHGVTIDDLLSTQFPYLTQVEALKLAAQTFDKDVSKLSCCAN